MEESEERFETRSVHVGMGVDDHGALVPPIYANATYAYDSPTETEGEYRYSRMAEPTRDALEASFADLEGGDEAFAFASGMAAIDAVFSLLKPGEHVVTGDSLYAETHDLVTDVYAEYGIESTQVDVTDGGAIEGAIRPETELIYLETPTNPTLAVADIEGAVEAATSVDALVAVDNTFASPCLQRPLELGADVVVESLTKYHGGHSDVIAGAVSTTDDAVADRIETTQYTRGAIPSPFDCFLVVRGMKTLPSRMARHCENGRAIAAELEASDLVSTVHYPGVEDHPNHDVATRQMEDFGGMLSFELEGGVEAARPFAEALDVMTLAESLGGVETLVEVPATMTHQDLSPSELEVAGIDEGLVRISCGVEHTEDLLDDIRRGLDAL